jgi:hypothetical protein
MEFTFKGVSHEIVQTHCICTSFRGESDCIWGHAAFEGRGGDFQSTNG